MSEGHLRSEGEGVGTYFGDMHFEGLIRIKSRHEGLMPSGSLIFHITGIFLFCQNDFLYKMVRQSSIISRPVSITSRRQASIYLPNDVVDLMTGHGKIFQLHASLCVLLDLLRVHRFLTNAANTFFIGSFPRFLQRGRRGTLVFNFISSPIDEFIDFLLSNILEGVDAHE